MVIECLCSGAAFTKVENAANVEATPRIAGPIKKVRLVSFMGLVLARDDHVDVVQVERERVVVRSTAAGRVGVHQSAAG